MKNTSLLKKRAVHVLLPLLCLAMLIAAVRPSAQAAGDVTARLRPDIVIVIDGSTQIFYNAAGQQVHPISYQDTTYLPLRAIGEVMGKNVDWNQSTKTATLSGTRTAAATTGTLDANARAKDITAELRDDFTVVVDGTVRTFADANGKTVYPLLYQGSTYLPIRAIGELMGKTVDWDGKTQTVTLSGSEVTDADTFSGGTKPAGGTVPSTGTAVPSGKLSLEDAKTKALEHAGLTEKDVTFTKTKLDWDDGREIYEIEFYSPAAEYDAAERTAYEYEIDAATGDIVKYEQEQKSGPRPVPGNASGVTITQEAAQEIALGKVSGATASNVKKIKLDRDDGKQIYEVEIIYNRVEYEIEIDAATGAILKFEADRD